MEERLLDKKTDMTPFLRCAYLICALLVAMTGISVLRSARHEAPPDGQELLSYEELRQRHVQWEYPDGWQFLGKRDPEAEARRERLRNAAPPVVNREQIAKDLETVAQNLRLRRENLEKLPLSPILRIQWMRKHTPQTYAPDLEWEDGAVTPRTGTQLADLNPAPEPEAQQPQQLNKPIHWESRRPLENENSVPDSNSGNRDFAKNNKKTVGETLEEAPLLLVDESTPEQGSSEILSKPEEAETQNMQRSTAFLSPTRLNDGSETLEDSLKQGYQPSRREPVREKRGFGRPGQPTTSLETLPEDSASGNHDFSSPDTSEVRPYNHEEGMKILRFFNQKAKNRLATFSRDIRDYSCILYKWDATNNTIDGSDVMRIKLRENPYSIYAYSVYPDKCQGREWLYWTGHYGDLLVINSGPHAWNRTLAMEVDGNGVRNCATRSVLQLGFRRLLEELVAISENEADFEDSEIHYYGDARVGERSCYALEVTFPRTTQTVDFYRIQIYVDQELDLPIQLVIYDWPINGKPATVRESYSYVITQLNPGFEDIDFCHLNPEYGFRQYIPRVPEMELRFMEANFQAGKP